MSSSGEDQMRRRSTDDTKQEDFQPVSSRSARKPVSKGRNYYSRSLISTVWDPDYDLLEGDEFDEMLRERKKQEHRSRPGLHFWSEEEKAADEARRKDVAQRKISAPYKLCFRLQLDGHGEEKCPMLYLRLDRKKEMLTPACMFRDPDVDPALLNDKTIVCSWSPNKRYWAYHHETSIPPSSITKYNEIRYEIVCLEESKPVAD